MEITAGELMDNIGLMCADREITGESEVIVMDNSGCAWRVIGTTYDNAGRFVIETGGQIDA